MITYNSPKIWFPAVCMLLFASCASLDRAYMAADSSFRSTETGFTFQSVASTNWQEDSSGAEANRVAVMEQFVERNGVCPDGYGVTDRDVIRRPATALGVTTLADIIYTAECL